MSLATQFDLTRDELTDRFHYRIEQGQRTKLSKDELGQLALHFVDRLKQLNTEADIQALAQAEMALLEEGYPQNSIGSLYLPMYRRLIQEAISAGTLPLTEANSHRVQWTKRNTGEIGASQKHYALTYLKYDQATYTKLRQATTAANNERQDNLQAVPLERYLEQATELLRSDQPELLAIAIAALTGRRHTEVVAKGRFNRTSYPYLLRFEGQQKDPTPPFDILTLLPAREVLEGIERFRSMPEVQQLQGLGHDHPEIDAFNARVNRRVHKLFGQIVPVLEGFKTVSIHRLRGVYGAISVHFFCPQMKHEHRFLQHYLGHLLEEPGQDLPNASATQHYFHYRLVNPQGQILQARGVKVMANGLPPQPDGAEVTGVPVDVSDQVPTGVSSADGGQGVVSAPIDSTIGEARIPQAPRQRSSLRIYRDELDQWLTLLQQVGPDDLTQQDKMSALRQWAQARLDDAELPRGLIEAVETRSPEAEVKEVTSQSLAANMEGTPDSGLTQVVRDQAQTLAWLTGRVAGLETDLAALKAERDSVKSQLQQTAALKAERDSLQSQLAEQCQQQLQVDSLRAEKAHLTQALAQAEAKLEGFRRVLQGNGAATTVPLTAAGSGPSSGPSTSGVVGRSGGNSPVVTTSVVHSSSVTPTRAQSSGQAPAKRRKGGGAKVRAEGIFTAIQQWNQLHPENTFAVNSGLLEETFGINRKAAKEFVAENQSLIDEHHHQVGVENQRSHNRGKDMGQLKDFVEQG